MRMVYVLLMGLALVGCGNSPASGDDAGTDVDLSANSDLSQPTADLTAGPDLSVCTALGGACMTSTGKHGLCDGTGCKECGNGTDASCTSAYGGQGSPYVCEAGSCIPGDCHTSIECPTGQICTANACGACTGATPAAGDAACVGDTHYGAGYICLGAVCLQGDCHKDSECVIGATTSTKICGITTTGKCGGCVTDTDCKNDTDTTGSGGVASICNTATGGCVSGACTVGTTNCALTNADDICCGTAGAGAATCQAGNCCGPANTCSGGGALCSSTDAKIAGVCTTCTAPTPGTYYVNPSAGSDTGVGSNSSPVCSFRTLKRALAVIGRPATTTTIIVVGDSTTVLDAGERYPIDVPANVQIKAATGPIKIVAQDAFRISGGNTSVSGFALTGTGRKNGFQISTQNDNEKFTLSKTDIGSYGADAILIKRGLLLLDVGVNVHDNTGNAIFVGGPGASVLSTAALAATGANPVTLNTNGGYGIQVMKGGVIELHGFPATPSIAIRDNVKGGVRVEAAAVGGLDGVVESGSTGGAGIDTVPSATMKVRNSSFLGNKFGASVVGQLGVASDVSSIDFGDSAGGGAKGGNTFQVSGASSTPNTLAGICLAAGYNVASPLDTLRAAGNIFSGARDCSMVTPGKLTSDKTCTGNKSDVAVVVIQTASGPSTNHVVVDNCTY